MKKKENKSVKELEAELTDLVENDIDNENIYHILVKLANIYIQQNKYVYGYQGINEVCHDVASDVWMAVRGGRKITSWMYYIGKMIKLSYVPHQKKIEHETIYTESEPIFVENVKRMCTSSAMSSEADFDTMERQFILESIPNMIRDAVMHGKFKYGTKEWDDVYTNMTLNLLRELDGEDSKYFMLDTSMKPYVKVAIECFKNSFRSCGFAGGFMDDVCVTRDLSSLTELCDDYKERG